MNFIEVPQNKFKEFVQTIYLIYGSLTPKQEGLCCSKCNYMLLLQTLWLGKVISVTVLLP